MGLERLLVDPTNAALLQFLFDNEGKVLPAEHLIRHWENLFEVATDHALPLVERWEFDCEICHGVTASDSDEAEACYFCGASLVEQIPRHVVELQQIASDAELLGLLKQRLSQIGLNEADFCIVDDHCRIHNVEIRLVESLNSTDTLLEIVDAAQPPLLILTRKCAVQRPKAFASRFLRDVAVWDLLDFWYDERSLDDFVASFADPASLRAPSFELTTRFQFQSPTICNALPHLSKYSTRATHHMIETMQLFLTQEPKKLTLFDTTLSSNDFLEHWVHIWLTIMAGCALKLGCIGKETGIGNPKWPDGLFELPDKHDALERTQYAYDVTAGQDFEKEVHQAQSYLGYMHEVFNWPIHYYYIISTKVPSGKVWTRYSNLLHTLKLPADVVFCTIQDMLLVLERLHGRPEIWENYLCFELETLFNRDKSPAVSHAADRRSFPFAVVTTPEVDRWLQNVEIMIERGTISAHPEYERFLRQMKLVTGKTILPMS